MTAREMAHSHLGECDGEHTKACDMLTVEFGGLFQENAALRSRCDTLGRQLAEARRGLEDIAQGDGNPGKLARAILAALATTPAAQVPMPWRCPNCNARPGAPCSLIAARLNAAGPNQTMCPARAAPLPRPSEGSEAYEILRQAFMWLATTQRQLSVAPQWYIDARNAFPELAGSGLEVGSGEAAWEGKEPSSESPPGPLPTTGMAGAAPAVERWQRFNDTTGALNWNYRSAAEHPDRCVCQDESTPHKHYPQHAGHPCARCKCEAYRPAVPAPVASSDAPKSAPVPAIPGPTTKGTP
jgi:hypothetical protein